MLHNTVACGNCRREKLMGIIKNLFTFLNQINRQTMVWVSQLLIPSLCVCNPLQQNNRMFYYIGLTEFKNPLIKKLLKFHYIYYDGSTIGMLSYEFNWLCWVIYFLWSFRQVNDACFISFPRSIYESNNLLKKTKTLTKI